MGRFVPFFPALPSCRVSSREDYFHASVRVWRSPHYPCRKLETTRSLLFYSHLSPPQRSLSSCRAGAARGSWGEGKRKRAGDTGKGKETHRPPRAPDFLISSFSLSFPRFLAISPLKEPLRRREYSHYTRLISVHASLRTTRCALKMTSIRQSPVVVVVRKLKQSRRRQQRGLRWKS